VPVEVPGLVVHLHAVLVHPGITRHALQYRLHKLFTGFRRVKVAPLLPGRAVARSLDNLVRYQLKFELPAKPAHMADLPKVERVRRRIRRLEHFIRAIDELGGLDGKLRFRA
jgi:hypothetical protein